MRIGTSELLLILVIALLALGPEKMPYYTRKLGKAINTLKSYTGKFTEDIQENIVEPLEEMKKPIKEAIAPLENLTKEVTHPVEDIKRSIQNINKPSRTNIAEEKLKEFKIESTELPNEVITEKIDIATESSKISVVNLKKESDETVAKV